MSTKDMIECYTALFEPDDIVEVRRFMPDKATGARSAWFKARTLCEDANVEQMLRANRSGWGIYIGVNPRACRKRGDANVLVARSLFVDWDGGITIEAARRSVTEAGLPDPTAWVESGHGIHAYWRLKQPMTDLAQWRQSQIALNEVLGSDPAIKNPERVMRLPGFLNTKPPAAHCTLVEADPTRTYDLSQFPKTSVRPTQAPPVQRAAHASSRTSMYGQEALRAEADRVEAAKEGERNNTLTSAAFSIGTLVGGGEVDRGEAEQALLNAALACGLPEPEARNTIARRLTAGMAEPREAPGQARKHNDRPRSASRDRSDEAATAELIVRLAEERYRFGRTAGDDLFAVRKDGPNIAVMLRGSRDAMRSALARDFRLRYNRTPNSAALTDALVTLQGAAQDAIPEAVHLRVAEHDGGVVLDLGDAEGRAVVIRAGAWEIVDTSPVLFRRTALTAALPLPVRGGRLEQLRSLLNISDDAWPLAVGWLVAALLPNVPHPILMLGGLQGTGKSCASTFLLGLFDPSTVENQNQPRDPEAWAMAASGSWGVYIANISNIPDWWSDALCKSVTGAGWIRRKLYTDSDLAVLTFRRVVLLTSIDAGALRGDLGDRLLILDLERIDDARRRDESELKSMYASQRPAILGALLDLLAAVLSELPHVRPTILPRLADFGRVLAAIDHVQGSQALKLYMGQRGRIAEDVVNGDPVGEAVIAVFKPGDTWTGSVGELLKRITPEGKAPARWPKNARGLAGRLKRLIPALAMVGVEVVQPQRTDGRRRWTIRRAEVASQATAQTAHTHMGMADEVNEPSDESTGSPAGHRADRTTGNRQHGIEGGEMVRSCGVCGPKPAPSDGVTV